LDFSVITMDLMKKDPKLLERRVSAGPDAEKEKGQRIVQFVVSIAFVAIFVLSALDHRLIWSALPSSASVTGDVLVALGLLIVLFVFEENTFTSAIIEVDPEQKVISTGRYAVVPHPMHLGTPVMLLGAPLALGS
jgi:protein-S-isoprenylcysteine O-methyltransferase Ste14